MEWSPGSDGDQEGDKMWYIINGDGERCVAVATEREAKHLVANSDWYVYYVYSNAAYMC